MKLVRLSLILAILLFANFSFANIWLDEDFDDGIVFDDTDTYYDTGWATNPPPWVSVTNTGALNTANYFPGDPPNSYLISAGQGASVSAGSYKSPTDGPFQYFQFGVKLGSIPSAGDVGIFRWNWKLDTLNYSFYVKFVSTGSVVNIVAGEDAVGSSSSIIDSISDTITWKYITVQVQKNASGENEPRLSQTNVAHGVFFYSSSPTPQYSILLGTPDSADTAKDWFISVSTGSLFIDNMYWEGGLTNSAWDGGAGLANSKLRYPATGVVDVSDWQLY